MQTYAHNTTWHGNTTKENETFAAYVHWFETEAKRCSFNTDTATICIIMKGIWDAHNITPKIYKKDPQTSSEVIKLVEKFNTAKQVTTTLTSSIINMMSNDDQCFVCRKTDHIGHHCPEVQCYNCEEFRHFTQECPDKSPPLGAPHHHKRLYSWLFDEDNNRDRSQSLNYIHGHRRCLDQSWSHNWSFHGRNSSSYWGHASSPKPTTTAAHVILWLTMALGNPPTGTHHTSATCLI